MCVRERMLVRVEATWMTIYQEWAVQLLLMMRGWVKTRNRPTGSPLPPPSEWRAMDDKIWNLFMTHQSTSCVYCIHWFMQLHSMDRVWVRSLSLSLSLSLVQVARHLIQLAFTFYQTWQVTWQRARKAERDEEEGRRKKILNAFVAERERERRERWRVLVNVASQLNRCTQFTNYWKLKKSTSVHCRAKVKVTLFKM